MVRCTSGRVIACVLLGISLASSYTTSADAQPNFYDGFENEVGRDHVWTPWGGTPGSNVTPVGFDNLPTTDTAHNHTPGGFRAARAWESDPAHWDGYSDFGATSGAVDAEIWLYDGLTHDGSNPAQPVTIGLSLFGDGSNPNVLSDYLQIGVFAGAPSNSSKWSISTKYNAANGLGNIVASNISREAGWTLLRIEADPLSAGGQVRFYVDTPSLPETLIGTSYRAGANGDAGGLSPVDLRWVMMGNPAKSYENIWYDDVSVVPEPACAAAIVFAAAGLLIRGRRRAV